MSLFAFGGGDRPFWASNEVFYCINCGKKTNYLYCGNNCRSEVHDQMTKKHCLMTGLHHEDEPCDASKLINEINFPNLNHPHNPTEI